MCSWFAGKAAVKALLSPAYAKAKSVPKVENEDDAHSLLGSMIPFAFYLRVDRGQPTGSSSNSPKLLNINQVQSFQPDAYYAWFYEGSQVMTYVGGFAMLAVMLAGVMFPLWPPIMRLGVWYISIAVLAFIGLFFVIAVLRLIFYVITVFAVKPGIWIFPQLFADVGFVSIFLPQHVYAMLTHGQVESFIPVWDWEHPKKKGKKKGKEDKEVRSEKGDANGKSTQVDVRSVSPDTGSSRPESRQARVEDVPEDS